MPGISLPWLCVCISLKGMQEKWGKKQDHTHPTRVCYELCKLSQSHTRLPWPLEFWKYPRSKIPQPEWLPALNHSHYSFFSLCPIKNLFYCNKRQLSPVLVVCTYKKYLPPLSHTSIIIWGLDWPPQPSFFPLTPYILWSPKYFTGFLLDFPLWSLNKAVTKKWQIKEQKSLLICFKHFSGFHTDRTEKHQ